MSGTGLRLTCLGREDIDSVFEVERTVAGHWSRAQLENELQHSGGWQLAVRSRDHDALRAYVFGRTILDEAEILRLAVIPGARRQGVATWLLGQVLQQLGRDGVRVCHLEVRASNQAALRLYEKMGFAVTGRRRGYYQNPSEDAVLMAREMERGELR